MRNIVNKCRCCGKTWRYAVKSAPIDSRIRYLNHRRKRNICFKCALKKMEKGMSDMNLTNVKHNSPHPCGGG